MMKHIIASLVATALAAISTAATADTSNGNSAPQQQCDMGYVTGIGGSAQSLQEYTTSSNQYRYLSENPFQCKISDDGHASACTGVTYLRHTRVSVYDDAGGATMSVAARVDLDSGTYPVIIVVRRQDMHCEQ
jgi:hypothetical protein